MTAEPMPTEPLNPPKRTAEAWAGFFDSIEEAELPADRIEGRIPEALRGALYKNGPGNRRYSDSFFDGDGMIRKIEIDGRGAVRCATRFVRTEKYRKEQAAGRALVRTAGTNVPGGPLRNAFRPPGHEANTHVVMQSGRLLALEEGGHPYVIDANTLDTLEMTNFDGLLRPFLPYSAHPHFDARTGETFNFGVDFAARKLGLQTFRADSGGRVGFGARAPLPYSSFVHDFALSENFMIFHVPPMSASPWRFLLGLESFFEALTWRDDLTARFILVPRKGGEIIEFDAPSRLIGHYFGAYERGDEIVIDAAQLGGWDAVADDTRRYRSSDWSGFSVAGARRFRLHKKRGMITDEAISTVPAEFPRIHPLMEARDARFGYAACNSTPSEGGLFRAVLKLDRHRGNESIFDFGSDKVSLEPVFVPHPDAGSEEEDRGFLLCLVYDGRSRKSELSILDARCVEDGPVATIHLPINMGATFHGTFVQA